jgi:hypothetical protein
LRPVGTVVLRRRSSRTSCTSVTAYAVPTATAIAVTAPVGAPNR